VRPLAVILLLPSCDLFPGIGQVAEPRGVQAFISQSSVKAFYMSILGRLSGLDVNVNELNLAFLAPAQKVSAS
jgi:hypothetical protein